MSCLPETWITYVEYDEHGEEFYFAHQGEYTDSLPFDVEESAGVRFDMDGIEFEICGDLGGHAVYRRVNGDGSLYSMSWRDLSARIAEGQIEIEGVC